MLEVQQLGVAYGDVRAVWDVSFTVNQGEIVVLIGPNGAGKTSTMRTLAGLQPLVAGQTRYEGRPIHTTARCTPAHQLVEQGVILVHEGRRLFAGMSVLENLELGAFNRRRIPRSPGRAPSTAGMHAGPRAIRASSRCSPAGGNSGTRPTASRRRARSSRAWPGR